MKKIYTLLLAMTITALSFAQAPRKMSYQAVIRDSENQLVVNTEIGMQISVLQGFIYGASVYIETQTPTTNANGQVSIEIGEDNDETDVVFGVFAEIDWSDGPYFIKTETDPSGGTNYTITGTSQLLSVPYAFHAKTVENIIETDPVFNSTFNIISPQDGDLLRFDEVSQRWIKYTPDYAAGTHTHEAATDEAAGFMSAADKEKLDRLGGSLAIGESYQGGIIFWLDASGEHGLIAAPEDQSEGIQWYNGTYTWTTAFASAVGAGYGNTRMIVYDQDAGDYAAQLCRDLSLGGFNDWYLPSKYELNLMYQNIGQGNLLGLGNVGGFASVGYWSSTENDSIYAWQQNFANGSQYDGHKFSSTRVRAVRAF